MRVKLSDVMRAHWDVIKFSPETFELEFDEDEAEEEAKAEIHVKDKEAFSPIIDRPVRTTEDIENYTGCLLYTSPSPRDLSTSRMPSSA